MSEMDVKVWPLSLERVDITAGGMTRGGLWWRVTAEKLQVLSLVLFFIPAQRDDKKSKAAEQEATTPVFLLTTSES